MSMDNFNKAVLTVLKHEGKFVNDPDDPGGATNYGISLRFLLSTGDLKLGDIDHDGDIDADDIKKMSIEEAKNLYFTYWWLKYNYESIPNLALSTKIFDAAVNMGAKQAHILVQRACRACGIRLVEDGVLGPNSMGAISTLISGSSDDALLASIRSEMAGFYRSLITKKPVFEKYRNGWLNRAYS